MKKTEEMKAKEAEWREQAAAIAKNGFYKQLPAARAYIERHLADVWRFVLGIEDDDVPIADMLKLTPTMTLMIHLFAKAGHKHGAARSRAPLVKTWPPMMSNDGETLRYPMAMPQRDIARMIGKSVGSVKEAIARLRGNREGYESINDNRVAFPVPYDTGIALDLMLSPQCSFNFMLEDYELALMRAKESQFRDAPTIMKTIQWSHDAIADASPGVPSTAGAVAGASTEATGTDDA